MAVLGQVQFAIPQKNGDVYAFGKAGDLSVATVGTPPSGFPAILERPWVHVDSSLITPPIKL